MQHQILINIIIFVAYVLNLPLNTQRSHSRSQRAGKWSLILAHDRRPIYRAPTYIAVPLLGPHQPRYIGLTLYWAKSFLLLENILLPIILFWSNFSKTGFKEYMSSKCSQQNLQRPILRSKTDTFPGGPKTFSGFSIISCFSWSLNHWRSDNFLGLSLNTDYIFYQSSK